MSRNAAAVTGGGECEPNGEHEHDLDSTRRRLRLVRSAAVVAADAAANGRAIAIETCFTQSADAVGGEQRRVLYPGSAEPRTASRLGARF